MRTVVGLGRLPVRRILHIQKTHYTPVHKILLQASRHSGTNRLEIREGYLSRDAPISKTSGNMHRPPGHLPGYT
jgi:hypothetical protein